MNLSHLSERELQGLDYILKNTESLASIPNIKEMECTKGISVGAIYVLAKTAEKLGIKKALGNSDYSRYAFWLILSRILDQGSRLSAVRSAFNRAVPEILGITKMDEYDLYKTLDWLADNQGKIEDRLFRERTGGALFLYDLTSVYLEGQENELGAYGYNRDKKRGKKQIVAGLLTDIEGVPISIEVFKGNTTDPQTFYNQIEKTAQRFGCKRVVFVGDRGMIKSAQINDLGKEQFNYITAITKEQIKKLVKDGILQYELFEEALCEVTDDDIRYIVRRNRLREREIDDNRESKIQCVKKILTQSNEYLNAHPRAKEETQLQKIKNKLRQLKLTSFIDVQAGQRNLTLSIDKEVREEISRYDGCYCIKTDVPGSDACAEQIHSRYKDLAYVERAFRDMKTVELEAQPIYVRKESRTRGHMFIVMLAYMIIQYLEKQWSSLNLTVREGILELDRWCSAVIQVKGHTAHIIPKPDPLCRQLLKPTQIVLPHALPFVDHSRVATKKSLVPSRLKH